MRDLAIANFSIILARLNHALKLTSRDSYVEAERVWRRQGRSGFDIIKAVWRESDIPVRTHQEMLGFLVYGSPTLRYALHLIQRVVLVDQDIPGHKNFYWVKHTPFMLGTRKWSSVMRISTSPPCTQVSAKWKGRSWQTDSMSRVTFSPSK